MVAGLPGGTPAGCCVCAIAVEVAKPRMQMVAKMWIISSPPDGSKRQHVGNQVLLFFIRKLEPKNQIEEFHAIRQRQQTTIMQIGGESLIPRSVKVLIGPSGSMTNP
jgi:hypothetical protein